ncbi:MAG: ABC transporter ATP-binding protein [Candidatus Heimdallarchaeota archaeon]|nr:MAG: ABC transporter ATP-binding protein [Candidatus Heimdallarchaeota archaeon]
MKDQPIIETRKLWKIYYAETQEVEAIRDVSIKIPSGKTTCIAGPSGSGKSTLLALIGLLTYPSEGQVVLEGESTSGLSEIFLTKIRRKKFGFIFQSQYLLPHYTSLENTILPLLAQDISYKDATQQAIAVLEKLELEERVNFRVRQLSGGEAQRVCIARALVTNPSILVADEPSAHIDSRLTEEFLQLLLTLKEEHQLTVIMASHDPQIIKIADKEIELKDGAVKNGLFSKAT